MIDVVVVIQYGYLFEVVQTYVKYDRIKYMRFNIK